MVVVGYPEALNVVVVDWIGWIGDVYTDVVGRVYGIVVYDEPDMVAVVVMSVACDQSDIFAPQPQTS